MTKFEIAKMAVSKFAGRNRLILQKYSTEILIVTVIDVVVASDVMACRATLKLEEVMIEGEDKISEIKYAEENDADPAVNYKKDLTKAYVRTGTNLVKLYGPSVLMGTASIACIVGSHNIMKGRNLALVAAYKTIEQGFGNYRRQVIDEFGEEKDKQYRYGLSEEAVSEVEKDENGKSKKVKKSIESSDPNKIGPYSKFFDESNPNWSPNAEYNLNFLRCSQTYANDMLFSRGHIFLNEVYDMLGMDRTGAGQVVGWVRNKDGSGDNYVDFGMYDLNSPEARRFINGAERSILLNFNVDGVVHDKI